MASLRAQAAFSWARLCELTVKNWAELDSSKNLPSVAFDLPHKKEIAIEHLEVSHQ